MIRNSVLFSTAILWVLTSAAVLADNFALAVPGPPGLELEFRGYGVSGAELFSETASVTETIDGLRQYVVRVDESIFARNVLARWCVADPTGAWTPITTADDHTVCDETPRETRGTYSFEAAELLPAPRPFFPEGVDIWWGPDEPVADWTRFCISGDERSCVVRRDLVGEAGSISASLILRSQAESDEYVVQVRLPSGGLVHEPTTWQIDQNDAFKVQYSYCLKDWCVIKAMAGGSGIDGFKRGNALAVSAVDRANKPFTVTFGLDGFTSAFDGEGELVAAGETSQPQLTALEPQDWSKACDGNTCIYHTIVGAMDGNAPARLLMRVVEGQPPMLVASTAPGMDLSRGLILRYGDSANPLSFLVCDAVFCSAQARLSPEFYERILSEETVSIEFMGLDDKEHAVDFAMAGLKTMLEAE